MRLLETTIEKGVLVFQARTDSYISVLPADVIAQARKFQNHAGFTLFSGADMAEWANRSSQEVYNKPSPSFIIACDEDASDCIDRTNYVELIDTAIALRNALDKLAN